MESTETDKALAQLLRTLSFILFISGFALIFSLTWRILPEDKKNDFINSFFDSQNSFRNPLSQTLTKSKSHTSTKDPPTPQTLRAADHTNSKKHHLILAATGSVATIKLPNIIQSLSHHNSLSIRIILTPSAKSFLQGQSSEQPSLTAIAKLPNVEAIYQDKDEWRQPWTRGAPILHIELRRWADLMVIAPTSANALAKIAGGFSDSLVYSVARAWDVTGLIDGARPGVPLPYGKGRDRKGIIVAPAMNTAMWEHPATKAHMEVLEEEWNVRNGGWVEVLRPVEKDLACGDIGGGAMKEWKEIVRVIEERLGLNGGRSDGEFVDVQNTTSDETGDKTRSFVHESLL